MLRGSVQTGAWRPAGVGAPAGRAGGRQGRHRGGAGGGLGARRRTPPARPRRAAQVGAFVGVQGWRVAGREPRQWAAAQPAHVRSLASRRRGGCGNVAAASGPLRRAGGRGAVMWWLLVTGWLLVGAAVGAQRVRGGARGGRDTRRCGRRRRCGTASVQALQDQVHHHLQAALGGGVGQARQAGQRQVALLARQRARPAGAGGRAGAAGGRGSGAWRGAGIDSSLSTRLLSRKPEQPRQAHAAAGRPAGAHLSMPPPSCTSSSARSKEPSSRKRPRISSSSVPPTISSWRRGEGGAGGSGGRE